MKIIAAFFAFGTALAMVGAMMRSGAENLGLREVWTNMPMQAGPALGKANVLINGTDLLPRERRYHRYMGSLTTPPCSEGVNWFVLRQSIPVSVEQIGKFVRAIGHNARPLQPANNRLVLTPAAGN